MFLFGSLWVILIFSFLWGQTKATGTEARNRQRPPVVRAQIFHFSTWHHGRQGRANLGQTGRWIVVPRADHLEVETATGFEKAVG